jgi:hypothetical protein
LKKSKKGSQRRDKGNRELRIDLRKFGGTFLLHFLVNYLFELYKCELLRDFVYEIPSLPFVLFGDGKLWRGEEGKLSSSSCTLPLVQFVFSSLIHIEGIFVCQNLNNGSNQVNFCCINFVLRYKITLIKQTKFFLL